MILAIYVSQNYMICLLNN